MQRKVFIGLCGLLLTGLILYPLVRLVVGSFTLGEGVGLENFYQVFLDPRLRGAVSNTLWIAMWTTILSLATGIPLAWVISRTNVWGGGLFKVLTGVAFLMPAYQISLSYLLLMGPNAGYLNRWMSDAFGLQQGPFNIYSMPGIIMVSVINTFPYVVFLCSAALRSVDGRLEQSAQVLGAGRFRVLTGITWKLVTPAVFAAALLVFIQSMSMFGTHAFLGLPARIYTLPTRIFALFFQFPPDYAGAAALSMILVTTTALFLFAQRRFLAKRSYVTIAGKSARPSITRLDRPARLAVGAICQIFFAFAVYMPVAVLIWVSLTESRIDATMTDLTLRNYQDVLFNVGLTKRGLQNSLILATAAATVGALLAALVGYMVVRTKGRGARFLDYVAMVPLGIPGVAFAVGLILAWIRVPLPVYGTAWILFLAYLARAMPLGVRAADSSVRQIDSALEDAARLSGGTWLRSVADVTIPLMKGGLIAAWALIFMTSFQELGATILLYSPGGETIAVAVFDRVSDGRLEQAAAICVVAMIVTAVILMGLNRLSGGAVAKRVGVDGD